MTLLVGVQLGDVAVLAADDRHAWLGQDGDVLEGEAGSKVLGLRDGWVSAYGTAYLLDWIAPLEGRPFRELRAKFARFREKLGSALDRRHAAAGWGEEHPMGLMGIRLTADGPRVWSIDSEGEAVDQLQVVFPGDMTDAEALESYVDALRRRLFAPDPDVSEIIRALADLFAGIEPLSAFVGGRLEVAVILPGPGGFVAGRVVAPAKRLRRASRLWLRAHIETRPCVCREGLVWRALDGLADIARHTWAGVRAFWSEDVPAAATWLRGRVLHSEVSTTAGPRAPSAPSGPNQER